MLFTVFVIVGYCTIVNCGLGVSLLHLYYINTIIIIYNWLRAVNYGVVQLCI